MRLIDADTCEKYFYEHMTDATMAGAMNAIYEMPTISLEPVKHGKWMSHATNPDKSVCSVCNRVTPTRIHYNEGVYGGYDIEYIYSFCPY